jgi:diacylglycerol kinase (ATP)
VSGWWVVVNPTAGRGRDLPGRTAAALQHNGVEFEVRVPVTVSAVEAVVAEGVANGFTNFAAVGGDGTAHVVVNALMGHSWEEPPTLGMLPAGSGGDFIRTFALPRNIEDAASHLVDEQRYPTDVGRIEGSFGSSYFLNAVNAGVGARSAAVAAKLPSVLGAARYAAGFWIALAGFRPAPVRVIVDGRALDGDLITIVVANGQFFGGGMNVAPRATVQDGVFDVQLFSGPRRLAPAVMPRVMRGTHLTHSAVRRTKGASIQIECPSEWPIEADGELLGAGPVAISVLPQALEFKI